MRKIRFWKRPFALALSLCMIFSAFGQVTYADGAETGGTDTAIETPAEGDTSSNPSDSSESGTQNQWGQDGTGDTTNVDNPDDDDLTGGDDIDDDQTGKDDIDDNQTGGDNNDDSQTGGDNTEDDKTNGDGTVDKDPGEDSTGGKDPDEGDTDNKDPNTGDDDGTQTQWVKYCPKHEDHDDNCGYIEGKHSCEHSCYYCENLCEHHPEHTGECGFIDGEAECGYFCEICNHAAKPTLPVCPNHPVHDESCGYAEGTSPCNHSCEYCINLCEHHLDHDDKCGFKEGESPCKYACPICGEEQENLCKHHPAHDETCGYVKGESPCKYVCKLCEEEQKNLCPHHTAHNDECGYKEGVSPCRFECEYCKNLCPHHPDHTAQCGFEENGVCSFACNRCVSEWAWVDEEGMLVYDEETGLWYLGLPGADPENPVTREILEEMLPKTVMINTVADTAKTNETPEDPENPEDTEKDPAEDTTADNPSDAALNTASETPEGTTESTTPEKTPADNPTDTNAPADTETDAGGDAAPTYAKALTLTWDLTAFPEEGAWEGSFALTAKLPEEYALAKGAEDLMAVVEIGGGDILEADVIKFLNWWSFVLQDGTVLDVNDDKEDTALIPNLSKISRENLLLLLTERVLPTKIRGWSSPDAWGTTTYENLKKAGFTLDDDQSQKRFEVTDGDPVEYGENYKWGRVTIKWKMISTNTSFKAGDKITLQAYIEQQIVSGKTYQIYVNSNNPDDHKKLPGETVSPNQDTRKNPGILNYTIILRDWDEVKGDHIVTPANPQNVTVNLFDYWVKTEKPTAPDGDILGKSDVHYHEDGDSMKVGDTPTGYSKKEDWNLGINLGHLLLFGDGLIHAGLWNKGAGENCVYGKENAGMEKIVKNNLDASGYPELNLDLADQILTGDRSNRYITIKDYALTGDHIDTLGGDNTSFAYTSENIKNLSDTVITTWGKNINQDSESLQYLFDPAVTHSNKTSYTNVTGLFQMDDEGYYYYNMRRNFAEFSPEGGNHFILYDAPATTRTDGKDSIGNFFPFNKGIEVFNGLDGNGNLTSSVPCYNNTMNHHLGMTVDVTFRQPLNGTVVTSSGDKPMTFEFSGDDDVWVFIDDVLVLDIGGIHSDLYGIIDFATGKVYVGRGYGGNGIAPGIPTYTAEMSKNGEQPGECVISTTIKQQFTNAGKDGAVQWSGQTFASNTSHTLKMFYLERGNYDSSIALRFNLQNKLPQRIMKVDQYGEPLPNVEFELYEAEQGSSSDIECLYTDSKINENQTFYMKQKDGAEKLVSLTTNAEGYAEFTTGDGDDDYFNFADRGDQYYILKETKKPDGYRQQPIDIVLHYDTTTSMLSVANRWTTGAYACSFSNVTGAQNLNYAVLNDAQSELITGEEQVPKEDIANGLVVAVPMLRNKNTVPGEIPWMALYGGNVIGFNSVKIDKNYGEAIPSWRAAVLGAALMQAATDGTADWHLEWDEGNNRLKGTLDDLPGLANRYLLYNEEDGDLQMVYGIIPPDVLASLGISGANAAERYQALRTKLQTETVKDVFDTITTNKFRLISVKQFNRDFRSLIYIPNERRELHVKKIDQDGKPLAGAEFALFDKDLNKIESTISTTDENGELVFSPNFEANKPGQAKMEWGEVGTEYYLKETASPDPAKYDVNETVIPVVVGTYGIYADAGTENDGVSVAADVGRLTQTMRQYAMGNDVDITLQDVTAVMQTQESGKFKLTGGWKDTILEGTGKPGVVRSMNLHFKNDNEFVDYGLHDEDGGKHFKPFFVTDTGFVRTRVMQSNVHYGSSPTDINKDQLGNTDLTNLFSLLNMVIVTDKTTQETNTGELTISKKVVNGSDEDYKKNFTFQIELIGPNGQPLEGEFGYFYGDDKVGSLEHYVENQGTFVLRHDESITILGLPAGTTFTVTEDIPGNEWNVYPESGYVKGTIVKDVNYIAAFVNSKTNELSNLIIKKTVAGEEDKTDDKVFSFKVELESSGNYRYDGREQKNEDGTGKKTITSGDTIQLRDGEDITILGLPVGTKYTVTEEPAQGYNVTATVDQGSGTVDKNVVTGTLNNGNNAVTTVVHYTNTKYDPTGKLKIGKTVTGSRGETGRDFNFTVTLMYDNNPLTGTYKFTKGAKGADGLTQQDVTPNSEGEITFTLKHNEEYILSGLPEGTKYTVVETEANRDGYTTTSTGAAETISAGEQSSVLFTNHRDTPSRPSSSSSSSRPSSSSEPSEPSEPSSSSSSSSSRSSSSSSGSSKPSSSSNSSSSSTPEPPPELPDPNDPDSPDRVTIEYPNGETRTYVKVWDPEKGEWVYILDEDVPMTGMDWQIIWILLYVGALLAVIGLICRRKAGETDEKKE